MNSDIYNRTVLVLGSEDLGLAACHCRVLEQLLEGDYLEFNL